MNALRRNVRFVSALGHYTDKLKVEESETMFRELAWRIKIRVMPASRPRGEFLIRAYLNYALGKLMIRKLREDWTSGRGARAAWHSFYDQALSFGGAPIPLIREVMIGPEFRPAL